MADRRRRETRETDDNEYEDEPSRLVPRWVVQESFTADRTQNDRMIEVQLVRDILYSRATDADISRLFRRP